MKILVIFFLGIVTQTILRLTAHFKLTLNNYLLKEHIQIFNKINKISIAMYTKIPTSLAAFIFVFYKAPLHF